MLEKLLQQSEELIKQNINLYKQQFDKDIREFREDLKKEYVYQKANINNLSDKVLERFEQNLNDKLEKKFKERNIEFLKKFENVLESINCLSEEIESNFFSLKEKIETLKLDNLEKEEKILKLESKIEENKKEQQQLLNSLEEKIPNIFENFINKNIKMIKSKVLNPFFK